MLEKRIIPCLLLKDLGLVKTVNFKDEKYLGDPINAVKIFNEKEVDELIFFDIGAGKKRPDFDLLSRIASECFMPFSYGGGIENTKDMETVFRIGAEKAAISAGAIKNPKFIKEASDRFGSQSIIVVMDVKINPAKNYEIFTNRGSNPTGLDPVEFAKKAEEMGAGEILVNSIDRDGLMSGYDLKLIKAISDSVNIPVIACGGAGTLSHFKEAIDAGACAVSGGSIFVFWGPYKTVLINYPERRELERIIS